MHQVMVLLVMPMVRLLEAMHRVMMPLVTALPVM